jgi:hypothetical protein
MKETERNYSEGRECVARGLTFFSGSAEATYFAVRTVCNLYGTEIDFL